ncbi:GvpL/GvpF family gas vesicle protein [Geodermatophilus sp. SYSU D01036]
MLLVHGVVREADAAAVGRVPPGRLQQPRAVVAGPLAAVVSDAPDGELVGDDAVAHLDLLVTLVVTVPVLPLPFGTVAPDEDAVRAEVLEPSADELAQRLDAVADLVELRLDLDFDTDASVAAVSRDDPDIARLAARARVPGASLADRMAVGEAVAARVADRQAELAATWTQELSGVAEQSRELHVDEQVSRTAYLVRRGRLDDADAAVARLREAAAGSASVEYVGPMPVYSFLDDVVVGSQPAPRSRWGW